MDKEESNKTHLLQVLIHLYQINVACGCCCAVENNITFFQSLILLSGDSKTKDLWMVLQLPHYVHSD